MIKQIAAGSLFPLNSADYIIIREICILNIFLVSADAEIEIYIVFRGNLVQFLKENRKAFQCNVSLFQNAVDKNCLDIVIAGYHAVQESYELFKGENIRIICHTDCADIKIYRVCILVAFFDEYDVSIGSFHLFVLQDQSFAVFFPLPLGPVIKFTMANLSFMYVLFETFHLSNI